MTKTQYINIRENDIIVIKGLYYRVVDRIQIPSSKYGDYTGFINTYLCFELYDLKNKTTYYIYPEVIDEATLADAEIVELLFGSKK